MEELKFKLDVFEGPLDLLLHLLQKNKVNIYDIPISTITDQYLEYIREMEINDIEVSSEFLVMASRLLYIKSKMLLPKHEELEDGEEEEDPRQELIQNLVEYKKYKDVSQFFADRKSICDFLYFREFSAAEEYKTKINSELDIDCLTEAFARVLQRVEKRLPPSKTHFSGIVGREPVPVKTKIKTLRHIMSSRKQVKFDTLFEEVESRSEIVAIFLAILEMVRNFEISFEVINNEIIFNSGEINEEQ